jgi:pilus assembly protein Flp/PilA
MVKLVRRFAQSRSGATAIEYGLIAALISVTVMGTWSLVGTKMNSTFSYIATNLK